MLYDKLIILKQNYSFLLYSFFISFKIIMVHIFRIITGKFINNILYGKSLQNDANNINITLTSNEHKLSEMARESNFIGHQIIDNDLVAVATRPKQIFMNRAFPVGFTVLEKSKLVCRSFKKVF